MYFITITKGPHCMLPPMGMSWLSVLCAVDTLRLLQHLLFHQTLTCPPSRWRYLVHNRAVLPASWWEADVVETWISSHCFIFLLLFNLEHDLCPCRIESWSLTFGFFPGHISCLFGSWPHMPLSYFLPADSRERLYYHLQRAVFECERQFHLAVPWEERPTPAHTDWFWG